MFTGIFIQPSSSSSFLLLLLILVVFKNFTPTADYSDQRLGLAGGHFCCLVLVLRNLAKACHRSKKKKVMTQALQGVVKSLVDSRPIIINKTHSRVTMATVRVNTATYSFVNHGNRFLFLPLQ
ncbi:hypothetical protein BDB00DRAFT_266226 [Zychaea mexicana]|uniref:uncharacterized protein n=1 Tax=Zychaea mexicana TaxID=64656 RepID=UPI0022FEEF14|nr:uncharacterized protein BDB00DRAFT_266226 [Zychaea mexicana]KAI9495015.1 hypothetical protein BDB00DRAFT_266226 [Zychaea mexicana]